MNYLAHAYLSFNNTDLLLGNMISDFVKGKKQYEYPIDIQKGIQLHRAIDAFTDTHHATKEIQKLFKPAYALYAAPIADVVYDHFLANDKKQFPSSDHLKNFTADTYTLLDRQSEHFPVAFAGMFQYMRRQDWLFGYASDEGINHALGGLKRRAKYISETETAFAIFLQNKPMIKSCYETFFPEVKKLAAHKT